MKTYQKLLTLSLLISSISLTACSSMTPQDKRVVGTGAGAVAGGVLGDALFGGPVGAIGGAVAGGVAGNVVGNHYQ